MKKKLAIITSHPIQYNAPLFELLARRNQVKIKVFYTWGETVLQEKFDPGFGKTVQWDIPLLNGYDFEFLENTSLDKGSHHFNGIINPNIINAIQKYNPDAILVYGWAFNSHLKVLRFFKNKLLVMFRGDSTLLTKQNPLKRIFRLLFLSWVYRHIDIALYVGKNNYDYYRKVRVKKNQLVLGPHAVDNQRFRCSDGRCKDDANQLKTELKISSQDFVFLFAGKLEPTKDPLTLVSAFIEANLGKNIHLVIVGNGLLEKQLKILASNNSCVHFLDFQNQASMPSIYEIADVFVLPSIGETWGLAVNEAMANGKIVLVSNKCGCALDLIEEGCNGYTFEAGNKTDLVDKLKKICSLNNEKKGAMKAHSLKIIEHYSFEAIAKAIEGTIYKAKK